MWRVAVRAHRESGAHRSQRVDRRSAAQPLPQVAAAARRSSRCSGCGSGRSCGSGHAGRRVWNVPPALWRCACCRTEHLGTGIRVRARDISDAVRPRVAEPTSCLSPHSPADGCIDVCARCVRASCRMSACVSSRSCGGAWVVAILCAVCASSVESDSDSARCHRGRCRRRETCLVRVVCRRSAVGVTVSVWVVRADSGGRRRRCAGDSALRWPQTVASASVAYLRY